MTNKTNEQQLFFSKVTELRAAFDLAKVEGKIPKDFQQQLEELEEKQQSILSDFFLNYQELPVIKKQTRFDFHEVFDSNHLSQHMPYKKIIHLKNTLIVSLLNDNSIELIEILKEKETQHTVKQIGKTSVFSETIRDLIPVDEDSIIVLSEKGRVYLGELVEKKQLELEFTEIDNASELQDLYEISEIIDHTFWGYKDFSCLKQFVFEKKTNHLVIKTYCLPRNTIKRWSTLLTINTTDILLGDEDGKVVYLRVNQNELEIVAELNLGSSITNFFISEHQENYLLIFVLGNHGTVTLMKCFKNNLEIVAMMNIDSGNLFAMTIQQKNAVILSDSGDLYLLEELNQSWQLNPYATKKEVFFTQAYHFNKVFLFINSDGLFDIATINKEIKEKTDLLELALYE
ncbi:hypothetical protein JZO82_00115 [Vagococcus fluvialis]|uniref:hypothetical protein n=1 Tax=Vagococcus fluvialis TaxID=2738 RepID=UPI001A8D1C12|nr:hypothetical protein [Vagococcus fluvialis]MBO0427555.1 hypothetical protein [Vagococcus fluvialis]